MSYRFFLVLRRCGSSSYDVVSCRSPTTNCDGSNIAIGGEIWRNWERTIAILSTWVLASYSSPSVGSGCMSWSCATRYWRYVQAAHDIWHMQHLFFYFPPSLTQTTKQPTKQPNNQTTVLLDLGCPGLLEIILKSVQNSKKWFESSLILSLFVIHGFLMIFTYFKVLFGIEFSFKIAPKGGTELNTTALVLIFTFFHRLGVLLAVILTIVHRFWFRIGKISGRCLVDFV